MAARYARQPVADEQTYQRKLEKTQHYLRPDMDVLEFGCGTGSTALVHAPHVRSYVGTDVSDKMIEIARGKLADQAVDNLTFKVSALEQLAYPNDSVDAVLGLSILHLLEDPERAIADVHRMLKPGGYFFSSTACLGHTGPMLKIMVRFGRLLRLLPLVQFFTREQLKSMMVQAGFEIEFELDPDDLSKACFLVARKAA